MKKTTATVHPLSALRAVVLHCQHLTTANPPAFSPDAVVDLVTALGYVQIDTLHVAHRAHDVTLWARFGAYDLDAFHSLIYTPGRRRLYEGWGHAASIIPLDHYRFHRWRSDRSISYNPGFNDWLAKPGSRALVAEVLDRIRRNGPLRVGDIEYEGPRKGVWYDWKPPKLALEALFAFGDLMVSDRLNFQRVYDVRERVLPDWVDTTPVDADEGRRFCLEHAAKALGVFEPSNLSFYAYMKATPARPLVRALIHEGILVTIKGDTLDGARSWHIHRENLPLLEAAADGQIRPARTTFLAPFDSFFWGGGRDERLWGFNQLLECYKPAAERVYGYFSFPILFRDRLIGRFDPKLDRKSRVMHLNALHLEPGIEPDDEMVAAIAAAMRDFLAWHGARDLEIHRSNPPEFGEKLARVL